MTAEPAPESRISTAQSIAYWENVPSTVDGMLGGYPQVSRIDIRGSLNFISKLRGSNAAGPAAKELLLARGVDCGAGIGRVTAGVLARVCAVVDVVEPVAKFAEQARAAKPGLHARGKVGNVFCVGLESWSPGSDGAKYGLIWNQWCLGHLKDAELVEYLKRCKDALEPGGWLVVKENVNSGLIDLFDEEDSSVTRLEGSFKRLFEEAGWKIVRTETQRGFPEELGLFPVKMWALQPK